MASLLTATETDQPYTTMRFYRRAAGYQRVENPLF